MKKTKIPHSNNWRFWITISLIVKVLFLLLKVINSEVVNIHYDTFGFDGGDTSSYIEPIENLILKGDYFDDYRMPGYGWLYYTIRQFANQHVSLNLLIIFQVILSATSVYFLSLISLRVFKNSIYFYGTFFIYLISTYTSIYDASLLTESFCTSAIIFSIYFVLKGGNKNYFYCGLFITWAIFLRPVFLPLLFIYLIFILSNLYRSGELQISRKLISLVFCLYIPFLVIDGAWLFRNYQKYNKIIPLTKSVYYTGTEESYMGALFRFMNAFGGSIVHWQPGSEITFFRELPTQIKVKKKGVLPSYIYTSQFNIDSLYKVRDDINLLKSDAITQSQKNTVETRVIAKLDLYTNSIKEEKPFLYYLSSRLMVLKTYFFHSGTYNLFHKPSSELNKLELIIKIFYSLLYFLVVSFGMVSLFVLLFNGLRNAQLLLISTIGLYSSLVFPLALKMDEFRYFVPAYPIFVIATVYIIIYVYLKRKKKT